MFAFLSLVACDGNTPILAEPSDADPAPDTDVPEVPEVPDDPPPADADGDGFPVDEDCDDADDTVFPGAPDICGDDRVTDCDRTSDDGLVTLDGVETFAGLRVALLAATPGSEVRVCPGSWVGNFEALVPIRLVAHGGAADTILDGDRKDTTLAVPGDSEIIGFTIREGETRHSGGGIRLTTPGTLRVEGSVVTTNQAELGAGIDIGRDSVLTLVDTLVEGNNSTLNAGGIAAGPGSVVDLSAGSSVVSNVSSIEGGGVLLEDASLIGGTVRGNSSLVGGGIAIQDGSVEGTVVSENSADFAGGLFVAGQVTLTDVVVTANSANTGGGVGENVELFSEPIDALTLVGGAITANDATRGGGVFSQFALSIDGTEIADNTARTGAGLFVDDGDAVMSGGALLRNIAEAAGGGVSLENRASFEAVGVDFDGNTPGDVFTGGTEFDGYGPGASFLCDDAACE